MSVDNNLDYDKDLDFNFDEVDLTFLKVGHFIDTNNFSRVLKQPSLVNIHIGKT